MIELKNDIESLRSLSHIFTPANFNRIVRKNDSANTLARINKHLHLSDSTNNLDIIKFIYKELSAKYKSEYLYKNALLNKLLLGKYSVNTTTVLNEFKIGKSIADFVLLNGNAKVFEIKTEYDSLIKLNKQLNDYIQFANEVYIVTGTKFVNKLLSDYNNTSIGIIEFTEHNTLKELQPAKKNNLAFNHKTIFNTLRKKEYLEIIQTHYNYIPDVPNTKIYGESLKLAKEIDIIDFQKMAYQKLRNRKLKESKELVSDRTPYELKHICYSLNLSANEYQYLNHFLNQKH